MNSRLVRTPDSRVHHAHPTTKTVFITACGQRLLLAGVTLTTQDPTCPDCEQVRTAPSLPERVLASLRAGANLRKACDDHNLTFSQLQRMRDEDSNFHQDVHQALDPYGDDR